jgi:hypothetical protein
VAQPLAVAVAEPQLTPVALILAAELEFTVKAPAVPHFLPQDIQVDKQVSQEVTLEHYLVLAVVVVQQALVVL